MCAGGYERRRALPGAAAGRRGDHRVPGVRVPHVLPRPAARAPPTLRARTPRADASAAAQVLRPAARPPRRLARAPPPALRCAPPSLASHSPSRLLYSHQYALHMLPVAETLARVLSLCCLRLGSHIFALHLRLLVCFVLCFCPDLMDH